MTPKKLKTNKLFYGKWPYKISTQIKGGNLLKIRGFAYIKRWCDLNINEPLTNTYGRINREVDKPNLLKFANSLEPFLTDKIKIRAEYNTVNIFVQDKTLYKQISKALKEFVVSLTEPLNETELQAMITNNKTVICDEYPKGIYKYKMVFKSMPVGIRDNFREWLYQYDDTKISIPNNARKQLSSNGGWWDSSYIYVADQNMVMLVTLAAQGYVRKTEEFILRSSINTSL